MSASSRRPTSRFQPAMSARTGASPSPFAIWGLPPESSFGFAGAFFDFVFAMVLRFAAIESTADPAHVQHDGSTHEVFQRVFVDLLALVDIDRAAHVAVEARVEQARRIFERGALRERELHLVLVGLARADDACVRPHRNPGVGRLYPLPFFDDVGIRRHDNVADFLERLSAPVTELLGALIDFFGSRAGGGTRCGLCRLRGFLAGHLITPWRNAGIHAAAQIYQIARGLHNAR